MESRILFRVIVKLPGLFLVFLVAAITPIGAVQFCQDRYEDAENCNVANSFVNFADDANHVATTIFGPTPGPSGVKRYVDYTKVA